MKSGCENSLEKVKRSVKLPVLNSSVSPKGVVAASRTSRWRAAALITLNLLMVAHLVQWWLSGTTLSPIEPSETMYTLQNGLVNAGFIFFILAIVATLIFGRFVCGWGCHIIALQDMCAWLLKKIGLTPRPFRSRILTFVPLAAALYMFVWPSVNRFFAKPANESLFPQFTNHLVTTEFWATFPPLFVAIPFLFVCGFMTVYFLGSKGFCTYGCPYGGFFTIADKLAIGKIRVTDACNECGHCTATCTSNVLVHAEVKQYGMVVDSGCMKCMDCISVCPNDALYFGFAKPAVAVGKSVPKNASLSWPEEIFAAIFFAASLLAVWDAYQLVPMLMALGIAGVTTFLAVRIVKLFRVKDQSFYRYNLKAQGTIKTAGWAFASLAVLWIGLIGHTGWIHYHESAGAIAFQKLQIPDELALARTDTSRWLSETDRKSISEGRDHLGKAAKYGLFANSDAMPKLAWFEYLGGDAEKAVQILATASPDQKGQAKALSLYYRGAILNRLGRFDEAVKSLDEAVTERPDLTAAREEKGESLWQIGRKSEAITTWNDAVRASPGLPIANSFLAGAAAAQGQTESSEEFEKKADQATPADPLFHWMLGLRLQNAGMNDLAEKHFARAIQMNPAFQRARPPAPTTKN